ncbi:MAG: hypothetical protein JEZ08_10510 [Clostridiales bacterium]|nr:hypothetical protein [Clostridiales bacterium]
MKDMMENKDGLSNLDSLVNHLDGNYKNCRGHSRKFNRVTHDMAYSLKVNLADYISDHVEPAMGYRVAMTNNTIRDSINSHEIIYGTLASTSISNGIAIYDNLLEPQIIANLLFVVNEDIYPTADMDEILKKTYVASSIEILDSNIKNWHSKLSVDKLIKNNSLAGQVVLGNPVKIDSIDFFDKLEVNLKCDGEFVVMNNHNRNVVNPLTALNMLTEKLAKHGKFLKKGMIVTAGTYSVPKALYRGEYHADFGILGDVTLKVR